MLNPGDFSLRDCESLVLRITLCLMLGRFSPVLQDIRKHKTTEGKFCRD